MDAKPGFTSLPTSNSVRIENFCIFVSPKYERGLTFYLYILVWFSYHVLLLNKFAVSKAHNVK